MPLQETSGTASYDAFGGGAPVAANYIEDVFSVWLYQGNGSTQTITNGIDLAGQGGMVWIKSRTLDPSNHQLFDTARGANNFLISNSTSAQTNNTSINWAFNSNGFSQNNSFGSLNNLSYTYASWTFRKQPKFFDVVTYTGNGGSGPLNVAHNLGSIPGFVLIKSTSATANWAAFARNASGNYEQLKLNLTDASIGTISGTSWTSDVFTTTNFSVYALNIVSSLPTSTVNGNGVTYVAYLFAHNAGGFGLTGTDNVISCGSFTTSAGGVASVTLNYEPQWVLVKRTDSTSDWFLMDNMRGLTADPNNPVAMLRPNLSNAENTASYVGWSINATGFGWTAGAASATYIYIAIRRGPMKTPTSGTSVFAPVAITGDNSATTGQTITTNFPVDLSMLSFRNQAYGTYVADRLRGFTGANSQELQTYSTAAEYTGDDIFGGASNVSVKGYGQPSNTTSVFWNFRRAPGFFDEVCYTGTGSATTQTHNLGVVPELMIVKSRSGAATWIVYTQTTGNSSYLALNGTTASTSSTSVWNATSPTASVFTIGTSGNTNSSGTTYVAYLFASVAGVSKVGSYSGTGATQTIDCGFAGGARWVMIKRTDSTGDWFVWDTARGMVAGTDPSLRFNSNGVENNANSVYTTTGGFQLLASPSADVNTNGGSYIYLAIA